MVLWLSVIQSIISKASDAARHNVLKPSKPSPSPCFQFDFGDSSVAAEWRDRITRLLNPMPEVFAQHDLDFGHTDKVKHHIKLND